MVAVLENVKDREQASSGDEEVHLDDEEIGQGEEFSEPRIAPPGKEFELGEDSLSLYFEEVGQTPLLNAEKEKILGSQIEEGKHLVQLEREWVAEHGAEPSAIDLLLALVKRFVRARSLFEALYQYLGFPSHGTIAEKASHADLRRAIDNKLDQNLSSKIAQITGTSQTGVEHDLIQLSLDSRLIPWDIIAVIGRRDSVAEFGEALQSPELHDELEARRVEVRKRFDQVRERARQATNDMTQANLRLVVSVAKGHTNWAVPLPDLIQEGNTGLMQAVQKFDHRRGYRFSTYAIPWIWQAINRAVSNQSRTVRLPSHVIDDLTKLARLRNSLAQKLGRQPTEKELASEMGMPSKRMESLFSLDSAGPVSLDTPVGDEGSQLGDFIADQALRQPEEEATASLLREELGRTLETLTPRERRIIELRFGLDNEQSRTLEEVGTELGLTKERIRQIENEALRKLRHPNHSRELIGYLG